MDNQTTIADVENFMVGPVFGADKTQPNGIIQFINKTAEPGQKVLPEIGERDFARFKELQ